MSRVLAVIQAHTASTRLPGKVLLPLDGRTVLEVMLERVTASRHVTTVVVATTTDVADDRIVALCERGGVPCFRGHATDLLDRHHSAAVAYGARHVVKIPSDCPLIDPQVIDHVLAWYLERTSALDYASNLNPATHPDGNDVEVMSFRALDIAWQQAQRPLEREHTTPYLWNRPTEFRIGHVRWNAGRDCSRTHRVVLDHPEDYQVIRRVYEALGSVDPLFSVYHLVRFLDMYPEIGVLNARYHGARWPRDHGDEPSGLAQSRPPQVQHR